MKERLAVFVNREPVEVFRGMTVKHALIAYDEVVYKACRDGRATVENEDGFPPWSGRGTGAGCSALHEQRQ